MPNARPTPRIDGRRHELDWIRAIAIASLLPYHSALIFAGPAWVIVNAESSALLNELCLFFTQWRMPLMFFVSGTAAYAATASRSGRRLVTDRVRRLLVPLAVGVLLVVPPHFYYGSDAAATRSYAEFYPHFVDAMLDGSVVRWEHLWYVVYLVLAELSVLPLLLRVRRWRGAPAARRDAAGARVLAVLARRGALLLLAAPLLAAGFAADRWLEGRTVFALAHASSLAYFAVLYALGFALAATPAAEWARRDRWLALAAAAGAYLVYSACRLALDAGAPLSPWCLPLVGRAKAAVVTVNAWCWVLAAMGFARHHLRFENRLLRYAREASYPVYILHQAVIVVVGAHVVRLGAPVGAKYALTVVLSAAITAAAYDLLVRRTDATRFMFGLRPLQRGTPVVELWRYWQEPPALRRSA